MWRITDDFWDNWDLLLNMFERAEKWCTHAGPGHWPDADMLPVGALRQVYKEDTWTRFTENEQITMMSLWCMMRSPLMVGADLPKNDDFTLKLLTNKEVLSILTTTHCAHQLYRNENEIVWMAPSKNEASCYIAVFNISDVDREICVELNALDFEYTNAFDLWDLKEHIISGSITSLVGSHGAKIFKLY